MPGGSRSPARSVAEVRGRSSGHLLGELFSGREGWQRSGIHQTPGFQLEARQCAGRLEHEVEAQAFVRSGERGRELALDLGPGGHPTGLELHLDGDLVAYVVRAPEIDLELVDSVVLAHDRLDRAGIDVGTADQLHVVPAPADAAQINVAGAPAGTDARGLLERHVAGTIADQRDEAAPERRHDALAKLAVGDGLTRLRVAGPFH